MISVLLRTLDFRGDHAADVTVACDSNENETVVALVERLIGKNRPNIHETREWIELRVTQKSDES